MTSVLNSSSQTAHQVKRPDKSTHSLKPGGLAADGSGEFGSLFGALMTGLPGQDLAATAAADGKLSPKSAGLASEVLGPSVHIITSAEPAISDDSLLAFARTQGMDEEALAMIFGRKLAQAAEAAAAAQSAGEPTAADVMSAASLRSRAGLSALDAAQASGNVVNLGDDARISWQLGEAAQTDKPSAGMLQSTMFGLNGVRSLLAEGNAKTSKLEQAAHPEAPNQSLAASLILGSAEASQFARRMQMKQATQRAERVADALPLSALANAGADATDSELPVETLTLETDLPDGDLQLMLQRQPDGGSSGGNDDGLPGSTSQATQRSDSGERAEQYEKLSQRLGEALGQRLAAQIAKGDWKVEMALRPIDLGKIDIELKMNQGELQASFKASEASTRDLIVNGLPKLKEVLAQLGMEVASVDVNVRQDSQSGGNPTPGKPSPGIAGIGTKRRDGEAAATGDLPPARSVKASKDGLDLMV